MVGVVMYFCENRSIIMVISFFLFWHHGCSAARNSPACKGKSLRCLRKCRFSYIDTSPALSARRHSTTALRYSARPPQRPSRSHLGCQTHQTYCFAHLQSRPYHRRSPGARTRFKTLIYLKGFGAGACGAIGPNEQIFGADEQVPNRGQCDKEVLGSTVSPQLVRSGKGRIASDPALLNLPRPLMVGAFSVPWQRRTNLWRERTNLSPRGPAASGATFIRSWKEIRVHAAHRCRSRGSS